MTLLLSVTAAAVLALVLGRLLGLVWTVLKTVVVVAVLALVLTQIDFKRTPLCGIQARKSVPELAAWACR